MPRVLPVSAALVVALALPALGPAQSAKPTPPGAKPAPAAPAPRKEQPVPFPVGETLTYDIGWSTYVTAGTATLKVEAKRPSFSSTAYYIVAESRPTPLLARLYTLYYKMDTLLDVYSLLPQRGSVFSQEGKRSRMKTTMFDRAARRAQYEIRTATSAKASVTVPAYTQDALSALYVVRSLPLKIGDRFTMPVSDNGKVYQVHMTVGGVEAVRTGIGSVQATKLTPTITGPDGSAGRAMAIWISNDARRLPVRLEAQLAVGTFTVILRQVTP
jgi:hypothetical protein